MTTMVMVTVHLRVVNEGGRQRRTGVRHSGGGGAVGS